MPAGDNPPCSVCGPGKVVGAPDIIFTVPGADTPAATCAQLEQAGQMGIIDPLTCGVLALATQEVCGCVEAVPENPIELEPVPENPIEPVPEPAGPEPESLSLSVVVEPGSTPLFAKAVKTPKAKSAKSKTLKDPMAKVAKSAVDAKAEKVSTAKSAKAKSAKAKSKAGLSVSAKLFKQSMA